MNRLRTWLGHRYVIAVAASTAFVLTLPALTTGWQIDDIEGMTVIIEELTADGRPRDVVFRFGRPLEDPAMRWMQWHDGTYAAFAPPQMGETVLLPAPRGPFEMTPAEIVENYRRRTR